MIRFLVFFLFLGFLSFGQNKGLKKNQNANVSVESKNKKLALLVGNSNYKNGFDNLNSAPYNDVNLLADKLAKLGFDTLKYFNIPSKEEYDLIFHKVFLDSLRSKINSGLEPTKKRYHTGLFYYSGHGFQHDHRFMVPTGPIDIDAIDCQSPDLNLYIDTLLRVVDTSLIFFDACSSASSESRNCPSNPSWPGSNRFIGYANVSSGSAKIDASKGISYFTSAILKYLEVPLPLEEVYNSIREEVNDKVKDQEPVTGENKGISSLILNPYKPRKSIEKYDLAIKMFENNELGATDSMELYKNVVKLNNYCIVEDFSVEICNKEFLTEKIAPVLKEHFWIYSDGKVQKFEPDTSSFQSGQYLICFDDDHSIKIYRANENDLGMRLYEPAFYYSIRGRKNLKAIAKAAVILMDQYLVIGTEDSRFYWAKIK